MLRSFTIIDPHLVNLIRENPRYTKMLPKESLSKFVSGRMMIKEARYVDDITNIPLPHYEPQLVALKAMANKEALPDKVAKIEVAGLNEDEMTLVIKCFKTTNARTTPTRTNQGESVYASSAVSPVILLLNVPIMKMTRTKTRKGRRRRSYIGRRRARCM
jgi:hypothetical protein